MNTMTTKIPVAKVEILWSENPRFQDRYGGLDPKTAPSFPTLHAANCLLTELAETAPGPRGGYDKTAFRVTWADGEIYEGRYDLHHRQCRQENPNGRIDLGDHMRVFLEFYAGLRKPSHMSREDYEHCVGGHGTEHARQCQETLEKYSLE
jgi:hypothetical protein